MAFFAGDFIEADDLNKLAQPQKISILGQVGTYLTTSGATEKPMPKLTCSGITVPANTGVKFAANLRLSNGTAGETFECIIRQGNPTSGGGVAIWREIVDSGNQYSVCWEMPYLAVAGLSNESFYLSLIRVVGSGVLAIEADSRSSFAVYTVGDNSVVTVVP